MIALVAEIPDLGSLETPVRVRALIIAQNQGTSSDCQGNLCLCCYVVMLFP
jgi:hypothetical protein